MRHDAIKSKQIRLATLLSEQRLRSLRTAHRFRRFVSLISDEFEVRFGEGLSHLSEYFCTTKVVVAAIGCALECFLVFG